MRFLQASLSRLVKHKGQGNLWVFLQYLNLVRSSCSLSYTFNCSSQQCLPYADRVRVCTSLLAAVLPFLSAPTPPSSTNRNDRLLLPNRPSTSSTSARIPVYTLKTAQTGITSPSAITRGASSICTRNGRHVNTRRATSEKGTTCCGENWPTQRR